MEEAALHKVSLTMLDAKEYCGLLNELTFVISLTIVIDITNEYNATKCHILFKMLKWFVFYFKNIIKIFVFAKSKNDVMVQFVNDTNYEVIFDCNSTDIYWFVES